RVCGTRKEDPVHGGRRRGLQGSDVDARRQQEGEMKTCFCVAMLAAAAALGAVVLRAADDPAGPGYPPWAYAITPPPPPGAPPAPREPPDTSLKHLPGTTRTFTIAQIADLN